MHNDQFSKNNLTRRGKMNMQRSLQSSISDVSKQQIVSIQVQYNRRQEILEYLKLFGYKEDKTILQVHMIGFFNKRRLNQRELEQKTKAVKRYGGTSFIVIGRTYDPSIIDKAIKPKNKDRLKLSPSYV